MRIIHAPKLVMDIMDRLWDATGYMGGNHAGPSIAPCGKEYENGSPEDIQMMHLYYCEWFFNSLLDMSKMTDEEFIQFTLDIPKMTGEEE
tara:strand:+ start:148 stop:417 length:270 start_codon:yes stop_codon:yes gene_type:complete